MVVRRRRIAWSQGAHLELDEAIAHVAEHAPSAALGLLGRILDAAASLDALTERGRVVPERDDESIRELLVEPFRLLYSVGEAEVVILGLIHQRQDFERWRAAR